MKIALPILSAAALSGCITEPEPTSFNAYQPATQALPVSVSSPFPTPWTDFITPNVTFEVAPDRLYEVWVRPGEATILNFPQDEFITSKSVADAAHFFLSQAQPNHYTPTDHRLAVLASEENRSTMLEVFTETRHYRIRLKSIQGSTFNRTVDWQLPTPEIQVATAAPFRPSDVPLRDGDLAAQGTPRTLSPLDRTEETGEPLADSQIAPAPPIVESGSAAVMPALEEWHVRQGQTLSQVLTEWTVKAGYRLLPLPEQGWSLGVTDSFSGDFESALEWLFSGFAHAEKRPVAILHSNRVIEIKEEME